MFYPFAFSPVCTDQIALYEDVLSDYLAKRDVTIYGVSCDAHWSQTAFREKLGVSIPQLSDFEPKGAACRAFGVYHPGWLPAARARDRRTGRRRRMELSGAVAP